MSAPTFPTPPAADKPKEPAVAEEKDSAPNEAEVTEDGPAVDTFEEPKSSNRRAKTAFETGTTKQTKAADAYGGELHAIVDPFEDDNKDGFSGLGFQGVEAERRNYNDDIFKPL